MGVLTSIAKILERTQSIIQLTFPTNSQEPDPNVLQFAALWALKLQSIVVSEGSLDSAPQPPIVITNEDFLKEVDRRIEGLREKVIYQTFNDISLIFDGRVLELTEGTCLPVPVHNRKKMSPQQVMNLFYTPID